MNRSVNIILLFFSFPALFFSIVVGFDLPLDFLNSTGALLPYRAIVFYVLAGILLTIIARRSVHRWVGVGMTRDPKRFDWCIDIGKERKKNAVLFLWMEAILALSFLVAHYELTPESWPLMAVYALMFVDQVLFILIAKSWFRIGITKKALVVADREVSVLYFSGLRRVEVHQQTVYFEYLEDLQLFFPANAIPDGEMNTFREVLEAHVNREKVYFSEKFKQL